MYMKHIKNVFLVICLYSFFFALLKSFPEEQEEEEKISRSAYDEREIGKTEKKLKKILLWTDFFGSKKVWKSIFRRLTNNECEENRCVISFDKKSGPKADALLFNAFNLRFKENSMKFMKPHLAKMPTFHRSPRQVYIFYTMEAPTRLDWEFLGKFPDYFNWTMTYRKDSDVYEPFGIVRESIKGENWELHTLTGEQLKSKKMAVWLSSNCYKNAPHLRENFIKSLQRFIKVDIYGKCGMQCDSDIGVKIYGTSVGNSYCENTIKKYAFYIAFENSLCTDYITEKIFKAFKLGMIPVVFGEGDYSSIAPKGSYIDYRDFNSAEQLAQHMMKVISNVTLYNEYMKWKKHYEVEVGSPYKSFVCDLCKKLHNFDPEKERKSYPDMHDWFYRKSSCKTEFEHLKYDIRL